MAIFDEIKTLTSAAEKAVAEHPAQVDSALNEVGELVDKQTGGTHHAQIVGAERKVDEFVAKQAPHPTGA